MHCPLPILVCLLSSYRLFHASTTWPQATAYLIYQIKCAKVLCRLPLLWAPYSAGSQSSWLTGWMDMVVCSIGRQLHLHLL